MQKLSKIHTFNIYHPDNRQTAYLILSILHYKSSCIIQMSLNNSFKLLNLRALKISTRFWIIYTNLKILFHHWFESSYAGFDSQQTAPHHPEPDPHPWSRRCRRIGFHLKRQLNLYIPVPSFPQLYESAKCNWALGTMHEYSDIHPSTV